MKSNFSAKNETANSRGQTFRCAVRGTDGIICTPCIDPDADTIVDDPFLPKYMRPDADVRPARITITAEENEAQLAAARNEIRQLVAAARENKKTKSGRIGRSVRAEPQKRNTLPKWVTLTDDRRLCYNFIVINNDPGRVQMAKLISIIEALSLDCRTNLVDDYGVTAKFTVVDANGLDDNQWFDGSYIPVFIGAYGQGAFHYVDTPEPANTYSFPVGGGSLAGYGIHLPAGSQMEYVPYTIVSSDSVPDFYSADTNDYGVSEASLLKAKSNGKDIIIDPFYQIISIAVSHEVKEIIGNDTTLNWVLFDHYAATVAHWHWAEFDDHQDPPVCVNGVRNRDRENANYGYSELPSFLEQFPSGGLFFAVHEIGDVVSAGFAGLLNSYAVKGWLMENYPLQSFWKPYNVDPAQRYDKLGFVSRPLEPYGGMHQLVFFISFDDGKTRYMEIQNKGPVTAAMRGAPGQNNFPPNYVYCRQLGVITKNMNVQALIGSLENYGPSTADRT